MSVNQIYGSNTRSIAKKITTVFFFISAIHRRMVRSISTFYLAVWMNFEFVFIKMLSLEIIISCSRIKKTRGEYFVNRFLHILNNNNYIYIHIIHVHIHILTVYYYYIATYVNVIEKVIKQKFDSSMKWKIGFFPFYVNIFQLYIHIMYIFIFFHIIFVFIHISQWF